MNRYALGAVVAAAAMVALAMWVLPRTPAHHLHRGKVLSKKHHPMWMQPMVVGRVHTFIMHPEDWTITFRCLEAEQALETRSVSEPFYEGIGVGDWIELSGK